MSNNERMQAVGRYELLKDELKRVGIQAGADISSIREETNLLLLDKDFTEVDSTKLEVLVSDFKEHQNRAIEIIDEMEQLRKTYNL